MAFCLATGTTPGSILRVAARSISGRMMCRPAQSKCAVGRCGSRPNSVTPTPLPTGGRRLEVGMAHNLGLTIAKAVRGQLAAGVAPLEILRQAALLGARNLGGWGVGMTVLTALGNLLPVLPPEEVFLALFHGVRRLAADCDGVAPHRRRSALASRPDHPTLKRWLRRWAGVRHHEAAERTILTAISDGAQPAALADLLLAAETDRVFADGGHSLDFINKAFECLDLIGWGHAADLLPLVIGQMVAARSAEELTEWRQPIDLVALCERAAAELPTRFTVGRDQGPWMKHAELSWLLLGDDPSAIILALETAISDGADFADLGRSLCYAAALRIAQFGTANEHGDWETAHHVFTYCNAVHQGLKRIGSDPDLAAESVEVSACGAPRSYGHLSHPVPERAAGAVGC